MENFLFYLLNFFIEILSFINGTNKKVNEKIILKNVIGSNNELNFNNNLSYNKIGDFLITKNSKRKNRKNQRNVLSIKYYICKVFLH